MIHSVDKQQTSQTFPVVRKEVLAVKYFDCLCGRCIAEKLSFPVECSGLQEIVGLTVSVSELALLVGAACNHRTHFIHEVDFRK